MGDQSLVLKDIRSRTVGAMGGDAMDARVAFVIDTLRGERRAIGLDEVAASVNLSGSRLRHLFKREMALSFSSYVRRKKLERAAALLGGSFLTVKEIAAATHFNDTSNFARQFRRHYGCPPLAYRATCRNPAVAVPPAQPCSR